MEALLRQAREPGRKIRATVLISSFFSNNLGSRGSLQPQYELVFAIFDSSSHHHSLDLIAVARFSSNDAMASSWTEHACRLKITLRYPRGSALTALRRCFCAMESSSYLLVSSLLGLQTSKSHHPAKAESIRRHALPE